jgi:hypothetical protein
MSDPIDREVHLARSGRPHVAAIAHLEATHNVPGTAGYVFRCVSSGEKDPDLCRLLEAIAGQRDTDPQSDTFGCLKWYLEDPAINDTNASFFTCLPLALTYLVHRDKLSEAEAAGVRGVFEAVAPWFSHMSESPSMFYPNKCLGDVAMLLVTGHILEDAAIVERARQFARRYFDYVERRGMGWGEDHSPVYTRVIVEMALLIMLLEQSGELYDRARKMTDEILEWVAFNEGYDAVPSVRGYDFEAKQQVPWMRGLIVGEETPDEAAPLAVLAKATGYFYQPNVLETPRQWRRRTFDKSWSVSYIDEKARLGTLSHYPIMPNTTMHDAWGLAWQTKPASFIVHGKDYGLLQWLTEDDEGVVRTHEGSGFESRHLFKRLSFHPEVIFAAHQEAGAAIIFREVHGLHSPTVRVEDRWRMVPGNGESGQDVRGPRTTDSGWMVLDYGDCAMAIRPLKCRVLDAPDDDPNPQRRLQGNVVDLPVKVEREDDALYLSLTLVEAHEGIITQPLIYSGWCVVMLDSADEVAELQVTETLREDGEIPRTYGELMREVELTTPHGTIKLGRDMLTGDEWRWTNGVTA